MVSQSYANASQRLLRYAEVNRNDVSFAKENEIVYVFDTSVVESYWHRDPSSSAGRYGTDALLTAAIAKYSGWIALKFLMEHKLPGLKDSGFISPNHWNEALSRVEEAQNEIRAQIAAAASNVRGAANLDVAAIEAALHELSVIGDQPDKLLKTAEALNVKDIFTKIMEAVSLGERVRRVYRSGRQGKASIRDLTLSSYYNEITGPKMRHQDFRRWYSSIAKHRRDQEREHGRKDSLSKRTESDAVTLATIQMMYRANAAATGSEPTVRFVFVSGDRALHSAFEDLEGRLNMEGIHYFIRHPHVYAPLLNHATMASQAANPTQFKQLKAVMDRVEEALEPLFSNFNPESRLTRAYDIRLTHNINNWSRTVETLCLSDSHYVLSDLAGDYIPAKSLARILSAPDVRVAAANVVGSDIQEIRDAHLQMMTVLALETIERAQTDRQSEDGYTDAPHRAPVKLIGVDIAAELGYPEVGEAGHSAWLEELLTRFRKGQSGEYKGSIVDRMKQHWDNPEHAPAVQLLASCIFFAVNAWDSARVCAKLCQASVRNKLDRRTWMREARYCEALAIRMQLASRLQVAEATNYLNKNMANNGGTLASVRDRVERATLVLTAAIVQTIEERLSLTDKQTPFLNLISRDDVEAEVLEALTDLIEVLGDDVEVIDKSFGNTAARILLQAQINLLGAAVFATTLGRPMPAYLGTSEELRRAHGLLDARLKSLGLEPSVTASIYLKSGDALLDPRTEKLEEIISTLTPLDLKSTSLSRADCREIEHLRGYFVQLLARLSTSDTSPSQHE